MQETSCNKVVKTPPPLKSTRNYCLWCTINQPKEIRLCPSGDCPLYPFRFGKKPRYETILTPLLAIRERCKDCSVYELERIRNCPFDGKQEEKCDLYDYRMGKNPNRSQIGGNPLFKKHNSTPKIE